VLQTISGSATKSVTVFRSQYHTVQIQYTTDATGPSGIPPSGSFSPSVGVTYTQICPLATSFQVNSQATTCSTCSVCPVGQYVSADCGTQSDIQCTDCSPGKYADTTNFLAYDANSFKSCQLCTAGKFSGTAFSTCVTCSTGSFWSSISSSCEQCNSAGKYWASPESTCKNCQIGKYSTNSAAGVTVCTDCNPGTAATSPGLTTCSTCGLGRYASSASVCTNCLAGTYWDQANTPNTACLNCTVGTFASSSASSNCSDCSAGKFQDATSQSTCKQCGAGKFSFSRSSVSGSYAFGPTAYENNYDAIISTVGPMSYAISITVKKINTEPPYDKIYYTTSPSQPLIWEDYFSGSFVSNIIITSAQGFIAFKLVSNVAVTYPNPLEYTWTAINDPSNVCLNCVGGKFSSTPGSPTCSGSCSPDFSTTTGHTGATQ